MARNVEKGPEAALAAEGPRVALFINVLQRSALRALLQQKVAPQEP
jgi:hypothetical protein